MTTSKKHPVPKSKKRPPIINWLKAIADGDPRALETPEETVNRARAGDEVAARKILIGFYVTLMRCPLPDWSKALECDYAIYLAEAIEKILDGTSADIALGTKNSRPGRRPSEATEKKEEAIAAAVAILRRQGRKKKEAIDMLEGIGDIPRRNIYRAIKNNKWAFDADRSDSLLKTVAHPFAPIISEILGTPRRR